MAAPKKKPKVQASDIEVGNRTLEAVLMDVAERSARAEEQAAIAQQQATIAQQQAAIAQQQATIALKSIESLLQDLRTLAQDFRSFAGRTDSRLDGIEQRAGA